jgi:hypothetical protein
MPCPSPFSMASKVSFPQFVTLVLMAVRLKRADFERAMKLITTRIDVQDDDKFMQIVYKKAVANGDLWVEV